MIVIMVLMLLADGRLAPSQDQSATKPVALGGSHEITAEQILETLNLLPAYDLCHYRTMGGDLRWVIGNRVYKYSWYIAVDGVTGYEVQGSYILGTTDKYHFIIDGTKRWPSGETVMFFQDTESWNRTISSLGLQLPGGLISPSHSGAFKPQFPPSYPGIASGAFIIALLVSTGAGILYKKRWRMVVTTIAVGAISGLIGDTVVFEGSACGVIGQPILCISAGFVGRVLRMRTGHFKILN